MGKRINELTKGIEDTSKSTEVKSVTPPSNEIMNEREKSNSTRKKWFGKNNLKEKYWMEKNRDIFSG